MKSISTKDEKNTFGLSVDIASARQVKMFKRRLPVVVYSVQESWRLNRKRRCRSGEIPAELSVESEK